MNVEFVFLIYSEAIGVENPVFEEITAQNSEVKPRTLDIRRLPSDSDRHLLSEPNTPLSPEALPRFFPTLDSLDTALTTESEAFGVQWVLVEIPVHKPEHI
eukprot:g30493.t1